MVSRCTAVLILAFFSFSAARALEVSDTVRINFVQSHIELLPHYKNNWSSLRSIEDSLSIRENVPGWHLKAVKVVGGASPEGSEKFNWWLSENRARVLFRYLKRRHEIPDSVCHTVHLGRDWGGLVTAAEVDSNIPHWNETLECIREIRDDVASGEKLSYDPLNRIKKFKGGGPYWYMYHNLFPPLRESQVVLDYYKEYNPALAVAVPLEIPTFTSELPYTPILHGPQPHYLINTPKELAPFYMDVQTDMIKDALAIPNLGVEFYLGKDWSVLGDWWYAWWKTDRHHRYWRTYGGDLVVRKWFGHAAKEKPLTGHHVGLYGQMLLYDFEWGGKGYLSGRPGHDLWAKANWGVGAEYGYSLPVGRRWNIDFLAAVGYLTGVYREYIPIDNCYVWQATKTRHWVGPTKLQISLVYLIGRGNYNKGKGGAK